MERMISWQEQNNKYSRIQIVLLRWSNCDCSNSNSSTELWWRRTDGCCLAVFKLYGGANNCSNSTELLSLLASTSIGLWRWRRTDGCCLAVFKLYGATNNTEHNKHSTVTRSETIWLSIADHPTSVRSSRSSISCCIRLSISSTSVWGRWTYECCLAFCWRTNSVADVANLILKPSNTSYSLIIFTVRKSFRQSYNI